jgi:PAS domain S-box-containing protein
MSPRLQPRRAPEGESAAQALRRAAMAVARPGGPTLFADLVRELAGSLRASTVFVAVFEGHQRSMLRTLAAVMDGRMLRNFEYPLAGSPCERVVGHEFRYVAHGVSAEFPPGTIFGAKGMDSYAAYPLNDRMGNPLGLLVALDRKPIADQRHAEAMLKIFATRMGSEIERGRADEALRHSEASYRAIFDAAEDAIFIHDWDTGAVVDANPKACETYGYTREEFLSIRVAQISSGVPPYTAREARRWIELAKRGQSPTFEWHRRNKDGSLHWDEVRLKAATIGGKPHVLAFTRDITARKQAEEALRTREAQYRAIFDGSADALVLWSRELRAVDANAAFTQMYGYTREEIVGHRLGRRLPPDALQRRIELMKRALAGHEAQLETEAVRKNGERFLVELRYLPIQHRGEPHVLGVARDITERREREADLQRSEARLRATVEAAFDCVIGIDAGGRIVEFNGAAERCFGHLRADVLGRSLAQLIVPERFQGAYLRELEHLKVSGPHVGRLVEGIALRADGSEFPVEVAISVATVPEGSIFVGHLRDITARRRAEAQRAELEAQLRQAQKMEAIGQLTGGIAHDFNNILTSVIGYVVLAGERAEGTGDARLVHQLEQAHVAAQRARDLVAQMLAFARRQRGERRVLALPPLVRQTVQLLRATLPTTIELDNLELGADTEEATPCVDADPVQLEQVLFNLCINARDAIEGGTGRIGVQLREVAGTGRACASCRARIEGGPWVELSVSDSGCGIAPDVIERIFDPFYSTKEVGRGSGMGLAMVHGIVHQHGGHIALESRLGEGSVFRVLLPPSQAAAPTAEAGGHGTVRIAEVPLNASVLVVEDEPMVGDYMAELLREWGLTVVLQREPLQALDWLADASNRVDLLLTDHTMPRMTGLELARHAVELRPGLAVLLYTGDAVCIGDDELRRCGVKQLLRKPPQAQALRSVLSRVLAGEFDDAEVTARRS